MDLPEPLTGSQIDLLEEYLPRIRRLFGVDVDWKGHGHGDDGGETSTILFKASDQEGCEPSIEKANAYVHSLLLDDASKCVSWDRYQPDCFQRLTPHLHDSVEQETQAVLSVLQKERVACVWGPPDRVAAARAMMEAALQQAEDCTDGVRNGASKPRGLITHTLSPGAESNHDSCYDSDSSVEGRQTTPHRLGVTDWHGNVSRTSSDTLESELLTESDEVVKRGRRSSSDRTKEYEYQVQFALKLGYTEKQLKSALAATGPNASQDALLNELIQAENEEDDDDDDDTLLPATAVSMETSSSPLRPIVIDGSNVAMSHGNKEIFSCRGIQIAVDWFRERGHEEITVFVPQWRKEAPRPENPIQDQKVLFQLEREKALVFTPARRIAGKRVSCYDDRYVLKLARDNGGVIVSNDNYRDLMSESADYRKLVEERLLMYSFVNDRFMPPDDPLGRRGPSLDNFLRREFASDATPKLCPFLKKCTYGNKCKYYHPERGSQPHRSISEQMAEQARQKILVRERKKLAQSMSTGVPEKQQPQVKQKLAKSRSLAPAGKTPLSRTRSLQPQPQPLPQDLVAPSTSPEVVVSVTKPEEERVQEYNDKLTVFRLRAEESLEPSTESFENLQPPSWSTPHLSLRATHSDPAMVRRNIAIQQKLRKSPERAKSSNVEPAPNAHRKLARQLSLKGPEDSRLHQTSSRQAKENQSSHAPVTRLGSAPVVRQESVSPNSTSQCDGCRMKRQNSTSDPQLNLLHEVPQLVSPPSQHVPQPATHQQPVMMPYGGQSRMRIAFGTSYAVLGGRPSPLHHQVLLNSPSQPAVYPNGLPDPSIDPMRPETLANHGLGPLREIPQQQPLLASNVGMHPPLQSSLSAGAALPQVDPRYATYYHLCHLFPEDRVKFVMSQNPYETNPQRLCRLLLSL